METRRMDDTISVLLRARDGATTSNAKTAAAAIKQASIVAENLLKAETA